MSELYSDLVQSAGKSFYSALDSIPGIVSPTTALLQILGNVPVAVEPSTIFRSPAPAMLTFNGLAFAAPGTVIPAQAALSVGGLIPVEVRQLTITPALPAAVENPPPDLIPTLITIWTTQPATAQIQIQVLDKNVTQGGNIGFVSPITAQLRFSTLGYTLTYGDVALGLINVVGLAPTLKHGLTIFPDVGILTTSLIGPLLSLPFGWVDDDPVPASAWITDRAA